MRSHLWTTLWARPYGDVADVISLTPVLVIARDEYDTPSMREMVAVYEELVTNGGVGDEDGRPPDRLRH